MAKAKKGDRFLVTFYGKAQPVTVSRDQKSFVVFVRMDETGREHWFHESSLSGVTR